MSVIQGRRRGFVAALARAGLSVASLGYGLAARLRHLGYDLGLRRLVRVDVPVISIGNLTMGGTGKTPMAEWLAHRLARQSLKVVILARGYGPAGPDGRDDETLSEELVAEGVVRIIGSNPSALATQAAESIHPDVIIVDDGFQHRRLHRDLNILMIDAVEPFSNRRLAPRGLLREPLGGARRADWVILTRADQVDPAELARIEELIQELAPRAPIVRARHRPVELRNLWNGRTHAPEWLQNRPIFAFCGIGNPTGFLRTLELLDAEVVRFRAYPDHHAYEPRDLRQIDAEGQEFLAEAIVTTEKDSVKLDSDTFTLTPLALKIEMEPAEGRDELLQAARALIPRRTEIRQV